jgi:pimeloyl-ACP methyl ester carboxylesterase
MTSTKTGLRLGAAAVLLWLAGAGTASAIAATVTSLVTLETRPGATQKFMLIKPDQPIGTIILFAGGGGVLNLSQSGDGSVVIGGLNGNFLVRTRQAYVNRGYMVALVDAPSSHSAGMGLFRGSAEHAQDIAAVVSHLRQQAQLPVWLVGTSAGSQSAANVAVRLTEGIAGIVLTSSVSRASDISVGVLSLNLESIHVPAFVMAHEQDQCAVSPPADAALIVARLTAAPAASLALLTGGSPPTAGPCDGGSAHGFLGIEPQAVGAIDDFIRSNSPHSFSSVASGPLSARVLDVAVQPALADLGGARQIFVAAKVGPDLYFRTPSGWQAWAGGSFPPYFDGVLTAAQTIRVLDGSLDLSGLAGTQIFAGYGSDSAEMLDNGRYALVHTLQ